MAPRKSTKTHARQPQATRRASAGHAQQQQQQQEEEEVHAPAPEPSAVLPLLHLPAGVVAHHVLPHLGPWALAQVRRTCHELRAAADTMLPHMLTCVLQLADNRRRTRSRAKAEAATGQPCAANLKAACSLFQRSVGHYNGIELILQPHNEDEALDQDWLLRQDVLSQLISEIKQLGEASNHGLVRVAVFAHWSMGLSPALFRAICAAWPKCQQLELRFSKAVGDKDAWIEAMAQLPAQSLTDLQVGLLQLCAFSSVLVAITVTTLFMRVWQSRCGDLSCGLVMHTMHSEHAYAIILIQTHMCYQIPRSPHPAHQLPSTKTGFCMHGCMHHHF